MWELLRNGQSAKNLVATPALYLFAQLLLTNLFLSPFWIAGWYWLLRDAATRFLGYAFAILTILMIALHAKHYYAADAYSMLMAAGGVAVERWTARAAAIRPTCTDGLSSRKRSPRSTNRCLRRNDARRRYSQATMVKPQRSISLATTCHQRSPDITTTGCGDLADTAETWLFA
jgi:hypothetical protein